MTTAIVLYDEKCRFCNKWICFVKSKLQKNKISFLPFSSSKAITILEGYKIADQNSVVYIKDDVIYLKSRAVLKICRPLKLPYNLPHFLTILPTFLLDFCYDFVAKKRLNLNSNKECCNG